VICALGLLESVNAATWQGLEPFKSKRADVLQVLGKPVSESSAGALSFKVAGGTVSVSFVDNKFVENKKLRPEAEGTVLQIVLQHDRSTDTPESLKLLTNPAFVHDEIKNASIYRNAKEGVVYTFFDGKLKTTRYTFSDAQLGRMRRAR
jgi:hypothetical protein